MAFSTASRLTRRSLLQAGAIVAGMSALPLLAACSGQQSSASPTAAPAGTTAPAAAPAAAPTQAGGATAAATAAPTTAAAATAAPTTAAQGTTTTSTAPQAVVFDPKTVKLNGSFKVIQQKDWNPDHNAYLQKFVQDTGKGWGWNVDISYEAAFTGGSNFFQKMAAAVTSGQGPDMVWGNYDTFQMWYLKTVQPVDDVVAAMSKKFGDPSPGFAIGGNKIDSKWWSVPYFNRVGGWWARKSWFAAKNIDISTLKDYAQWRDAAVQITDASKRQWGWGATINRSGDGESWVQNAWFETGNRITDETGQKVTFDSDLSVQAFTWLKELYTTDKYKAAMPPGILAWDDMGNNNGWNAGTIGFTSNAGTLYASALKNLPQIGKDSFLVDQPAMPIGEKQQLIGSSGTGTTFYLMAGAKNPDATKAMIEQMLGEDVQTKLFTYSQGYVTPAYTWGWDTDPIKSCPNNVALIYKNIVFNKNQFSGYLPSPNPLLWWSGVNQAVVFTDTMAAILKGTSVQDAVKQGQSKIEAIAKQFNYK